MSAPIIHRFRLEPDGPQRLEVETDRNWSYATVRVDGNELASIHGARARLRKGEIVSLDEHSHLRLELFFGFGAEAELRVFKNAVAVPETEWRLRAQLRRAPFAALPIAILFVAAAALVQADVLHAGPFLTSSVPVLLGSVSAAFVVIALLLGAGWFGVAPLATIVASAGLLVLSADSGLGPVLSGPLIGVTLIFLRPIHRSRSVRDTLEDAGLD